MKTGSELISIERQRQIDDEEWTAEHDDEHTDSSLALAAICYATPVKLYKQDCYAQSVEFSDPWPSSWDDGFDSRIRFIDGNTIPDPNTYSDKKRVDLLVKAGALIAAEIDRLNRGVKR